MPSPGAEVRETLVTARWLCVVGVVAYPLFGLTNRAAGVTWDPLWVRASITALSLAALVATFTSSSVQRHVRRWLLALIYLVTAHNFALMYGNDLAAPSVNGGVVVLCGFTAVAIHVVVSRVQLFAYLAFTLLGVLGCALGLPRPQVDPAYVMTAMSTVAVLAWIAVSGQLSVFERLARSRLELRDDIERRRRVEQELRASQAQVQLSERLLSLGTLAGGVAHEINNPLTYVIGNTQWVAERLQHQHPRLDEEREALREAIEGCERIRRIVCDLRDQGAPQVETIGAVDVDAAVRKALRTMNHQLVHRCSVSVSSDPVPQARADMPRLIQVLSNLLLNAAQAFGDRPPSENQIVVSVSRDPSGNVRIDVRDNGCGIPEHARAHVFDPFFTTKAVGVGTGLGLYLCHKLVTSFGGTLTFDTRVGEGTTFHVVLVPAVTVDTRASLPEVPRPPRSILLIDDDPIVARSLRRVLSDHDVTIAHDLEGALRVVRERRIDAVLCDFMMPAHDGAQVYDALCAVRPSLAPRFVFMTGGAFTERAERFLSAPGRPCLSKPLSRKAVLRALASQR